MATRRAVPFPCLVLLAAVAAGALAAGSAIGQTPAMNPTPAVSASASASVADDPRVVSALELARMYVEAQRAYEELPGVSVAIVEGQHVLWTGAAGYADVASKRRAAPDTIYSVCSISKLFTSVALMREREAGRVRLEDPVSNYLS